MLQSDKRYLISESKRLLDSGGIDYDSFEDNYKVPRIVLRVAISNLVKQFPVYKEEKAEAENLLKF